MNDKEFKKLKWMIGEATDILNKLQDQYTAETGRRYVVGQGTKERGNRENQRKEN